MPPLQKLVGKAKTDREKTDVKMLVVKTNTLQIHCKYNVPTMYYFMHKITHCKYNVFTMYLQCIIFYNKHLYISLFSVSLFLADKYDKQPT